MIATQTTLAAASGVQSVLGDNPDRTGLLIQNDSSNVVKVSLKATFTGTDYSFKLQHGERQEIPGYTGQVSAVFDPFEGGYAGLLHITEFSI